MAMIVGSRSRRIVAAGIPGIAAADAPNAAARAANRAVFSHRLDEIGAASRMEAASGAQCRADEHLIQPNQPYQQ